MKKILSTLLALSILLVVAICFAADGNLPWPVSKATPVQNLNGFAPVKTKSRCDTFTGTKGVMKNYSTAGYLGFSAKVTDTAGSPVVAKRSLDSNTAYMPESSTNLVNNLGSNFSSVRFSRYSGASATYTICTERQ